MNLKRALKHKFSFWILRLITFSRIKIKPVSSSLMPFWADEQRNCSVFIYRLRTGRSLLSSEYFRNRRRVSSAEPIHELSRKVGKLSPLFRWLTEVGHAHSRMFGPKIWQYYQHARWVYEPKQVPYGQITDESSCHILHYL